MDRTGAIPSASPILWGLALLFLAAPLCVWLAYSVPAEFFLMLGIVLGIIGLCALANGLWAFLTTFDRMAERYLGLAMPGATGAVESTTTADAASATPAREE